MKSAIKSAVFSFIATAIFSTAIAGTQADDFGAKSWPVKPILDVNNEPVLCKEALSGAMDVFASGSAELDFAASSAKDWKRLAWTPAFADAKESSSSLGRLNLDLDGTGTKQVVIYRDDSFNWEGDWHYAYVFKSAADFDAVRDTVKTEWLKPPESQVPAANEAYLGGRQYYPQAMMTGGTQRGTGDVWADHELFAWNHGYYFFAGQSHFDRLSSTTKLSLYHLHADGTVSEACQLDLNDDKDTYSKFLATPGVGSLLAAMDVMGSTGEECGTLHSDHDLVAKASEQRAAIRPWATSAATNSINSVPYSVFDDRTKIFLEFWSFGDLWSRREYQTFLEHIKPAEAGYARYLMTEFGVESVKANAESTLVVEQFVGANFQVPSEFNGGRDRDIYFGVDPIRDALMNRDRDGLDRLLANPASAAPQGRMSWRRKKGISEELEYAVEWPYGLQKLLDAGANPNQANKFGKTPLMLAAHLDRPDSVGILLRTHADTKAVTHNVSDSCAGGMQRFGRSALTYAAENASPPVMKLLLDAGADPTIQDAKGNGLDYYLAMNPRLTVDEQKLGVTGLSKISDSFKGPSFNCKDAKSTIEKSICGSEVLSVFDLEIARAYQVFLGRQSDLARADQRDWIKRRDSLCTSVKSPEDCLAEVMRTRIRYLHNRNDEK